MRMTKKEVIQQFKEEVLPYIIEQYGNRDAIAKREAFNDYVDMLNKEGQVSDHQAYTWSNPY